MAVVALSDAVPVSERVSIGNGQELECVGIGVQSALSIYSRFPELKELSSGGKKNISAERIFEIAPGAISAIIAAGFGQPGNDKAERNATNLPMQIQLNLIEAIIRCTMPDGAGPFAVKAMEYTTYVKGFVRGILGTPEANDAATVGEASETT
jgi:hypothetical protein